MMLSVSAVEINLNMVVTPEAKMFFAAREGSVDRARESIRLVRTGSTLHVTTTRD
jgi:hypothetical protein